MKNIEQRWWFDTLVVALTAASTTWLLYALEHDSSSSFSFARFVVLILCVLGLRSFYAWCVRLVVRLSLSRKQSNKNEQES